MDGFVKGPVGKFGGGGTMKSQDLTDFTAILTTGGRNSGERSTAQEQRMYRDSAETVEFLPQHRAPRAPERSKGGLTSELQTKGEAMQRYLQVGGMVLVTLLALIGALIFLPPIFNEGWLGFFGAPIIGFFVIGCLAVMWNFFLKRVINLGWKNEKNN
jgi:hypothetical protein